MMRGKKTSTFFISILFCSSIAAQHPNLKAIDSLTRLLPTVHGIQKPDCLNALAEEYWWPPTVNPDSILLLALIAEQESAKENYAVGIATAVMLQGVAEIYKRNFIVAENHLRISLKMFEAANSDFGLGWCNVWLGQSLYSQNNFDESLACYYKSLPYLEKIGDWEAQGKAWTWMSFVFSVQGNYDSSLNYCGKSLLLRKKMSDHVCVTASYVNMGQLYKVAGAYEDAMEYYRQSFRYATEHGVDLYMANWAYLEPVGVLYRLMNAPDSSYYYLQKALQIDPYNEMARISFGETLLIKNQADLALSIFLSPIEELKRGNDKWDLMRVEMDIARAYEKNKNIKKALKYASESFSLAQQSKAKHFILDSYTILARLYKRSNINDSAYFFLVKAAALKDSILKSQFLWKLSGYKKQAEYMKQADQLAMLDHENKLKEKELREKSLFQWALAGCLLIVVLAGFIFYWNLELKRKNERLQNANTNVKLNQHIADLEMEALRAQMNPHFIFNCLSSINSFILKNRPEEASNYLIKFSRLIRMVLANSKQQFISIEDELETLSLYLDMEKLRFKNSFDYKISFINEVDIANIFVPPLLLQPFAENAIWHGLMHKEGPGSLNIELSTGKKILYCSITDNGIGCAKASELKTKLAEKQKSMGLQMTADRLALLNKDGGGQSSFKMEDIFDEEGKPAGTRVSLKIYYKDYAELGS
ncbi:MAG: histidine kinase [Bacteroidetes bacterium]|nr:histidine kinase [Bacteroidota bacterium]